MDKQPYDGAQIALLSIHLKAAEDKLENLQKKFEALYDAIEEIAFYGTSRPAEMGEDDGDGHYKKIAHQLISTAAIARRQCR